MFRTVLFLAVLAGLSACASMPLSTMYKLYRLSPMEADPAQIKIAIRAHENIGIPEDGVKIQLGYETQDGRHSIDDTYFVEIIKHGVLTPELTDGQKIDEAITLLQLSEQDAKRMKEVQQLVKQDRANDIEGKGFLSVSLNNTCLMKRPVPESGVEVDIFMQTSHQDGFFIFTENLDITESREGWNHDLNKWPDC